MWELITQVSNRVSIEVAMDTHIPMVVPELGNG